MQGGCSGQKAQQAPKPYGRKELAVLTEQEESSRGGHGVGRAPQNRVGPEREGDNEGGGSQQQDKLKVSREGGVAGKAPGTGGSDEDISSGQVERTEKPERARRVRGDESGSAGQEHQVCGDEDNSRERGGHEPVLRNKRSQCNEKTGHRNEEWTLVVAARESLSVAAKTQHNQN
ncbi:hypothetical protein MG293_015969 [Ovis ammon polii]|uniref:Uncharacterized protein n=1 Tax=Ovis ammon polii TaxID=230172 RepID=A0AAD4TVB1_OVIAM|nr:hypothetical protein MG293_015969 [Ovis ammon polii]